jgi:predicted deacylase
MALFPDDYPSAREAFLAAAHAAGAALYSLPIAALGPHGERLSIDIAWLGAATAEKLLIHSSGLHGVEGFAGSAVQQQLLRQPPALAADGALLLVHLLNPFGMAWLRRTNAANVDLNRNFIFDSHLRPRVAKTYAELDPLLNPAAAPGPDLAYPLLLYRLLRHGYRPLKSAIAEGQYLFPKGLFYGGAELQPEVRLYHDWLQAHLLAPEKLLVIDLHTGLGRTGQESLFQSLAATPAAALSRLLDAPVLSDAKNTRVLGYRPSGSHEKLFHKLFSASPVDFITHEFGTRPSLSVLQALRRENQWHHFGRGTIDHWSKRALKEAFCPAEPNWRQLVLKRGVGLVQKGLDLLAAGPPG